MDRSRFPGRTGRAWARTAGICFGSAAALFSATAVVFVWGGIPVALAVGAAIVAAGLLVLAFVARARAER